MISIPKKRLVYSLLVLFLAGFASPLVTFAAPVEVLAEDRIFLTFGSEPIALPVYSSLEMDTSHPEISRLIIAIHGATRRADAIYDILTTSANLSGDSLRTTWLIAPQFLYRKDIRHYELQDNVPRWGYLGWIKGDRSLTDEMRMQDMEDVSSYSILDALAREAVNQCPNLKEIVFVGHSGGGQTVQRYAATTELAGEFNRDGTPGLRFVFANPAGYLYFDEDRPVTDHEGEFARPPQDSCDQCTGYNDWHWGLAELNDYAGRMGAQQIRTQYFNSEMYLLAGTADTLITPGNVNACCEAMFQGVNRIARARNFFQYLQILLPGDLRKKHTFVEVPNIGHNLGGMLTSQQARDAIFRKQKRLKVSPR